MQKKKSNIELIKKLNPQKKKSTHKSTQNVPSIQLTKKKLEFPKEFPFWARMKIDKKRTALVIDEEFFFDNKTKKIEDGFVHREATHSFKKGFEEIDPNPDKTDTRSMYLKRATKKPKRLFEPHNKDLTMPQHLKDRYSKNNKK